MSANLSSVSSECHYCHQTIERFEQLLQTGINLKFFSGYNVVQYCSKDCQRKDQATDKAECISQEVLKKCHHCQKTEEDGKKDILKLCSGCKAVYYCSPLCQKIDWIKHKIPCREVVPVRGMLEKNNGETDEASTREVQMRLFPEEIHTSERFHKQFKVGKLPQDSSFEEIINSYNFGDQILNAIKRGENAIDLMSLEIGEEKILHNGKYAELRKKVNETRNSDLFIGWLRENINIYHYIRFYFDLSELLLNKTDSMGWTSKADELKIEAKVFREIGMAILRADIKSIENTSRQKWIQDYERNYISPSLLPKQKKGYKRKLTKEIESLFLSLDQFPSPLWIAVAGVAKMGIAPKICVSEQYQNNRRQELKDLLTSITSKESS